MTTCRMNCLPFANGGRNNCGSSLDTILRPFSLGVRTTCSFPLILVNSAAPETGLELRLPLRAGPKKGQRLRDSERFSSLVRDKPAVQVEGDNALSAELNDGAMPISMSIWMCELRHRSARTSDAPLCGLSRQVHTIRNRGVIHDPD